MGVIYLWVREPFVPLLSRDLQAWRLMWGCTEAAQRLPKLPPNSESSWFGVFVPTNIGAAKRNLHRGGGGLHSDCWDKEIRRGRRDWAKRQRIEAKRKRIGLKAKRQRIEAKRQRIEVKRQRIEAKRQRIDAKRQRIEAKRQKWRLHWVRCREWIERRLKGWAKETVKCEQKEIGKKWLR
jgi:hypothetical protein